jgi:uncharacterized protein
MKKILCALALLCAAAAPALAQPSQDRIAAAHDLLEAAGQQAIMEGAMEVMLQAQLESNPELREFEPVLREFFSRYLNWNLLRDGYARIYAERFTTQELREITAFFRTPTGRKMALETPAMMQEGGRLGEQAVENNIAELQRMLMEHMQNNGQ